MEYSILDKVHNQLPLEIINKASINHKVVLIIKIIKIFLVVSHLKQKLRSFKLDQGPMRTL